MTTEILQKNNKLHHVTLLEKHRFIYHSIFINVCSFQLTLVFGLLHERLSTAFKIFSPLLKSDDELLSFKGNPRSQIISSRCTAQDISDRQDNTGPLLIIVAKVTIFVINNELCYSSSYR